MQNVEQKEKTQPGYEYVDLTKESWSYEDFKKYLITLEKFLPMSENRMPKKIDTGKIGDELETLIKITKEDPQRRERGVFVIVNTEHELQVQTNPSVGSKEKVRIATYIPSLVSRDKPWLNQTSTVIGSLHTHPIDCPPSFTDLKEILMSPNDGGRFLMMVGTPDIKLLFLQTMDTGCIPKNEIDSWEMKTMDDYRKQLRDNDKREATPLILNKMIGEICDKHNIVPYSSIDGNTYIKASLY